MDKISGNVDWRPLNLLDKRPELPLDILLGVNSRLQEILMTSILACTHHRVHVVDNGHTAISSLQQQAFDMCLFSYDMPDLSAIEATKQIRRSTEGWHHIPIIGFIEEPTSLSMSSCIAAGMNAFIGAPFSAHKIHSFVRYYEHKLSTLHPPETHSKSKLS